jgi:hypothetical protein
MVHNLILVIKGLICGHHMVDSIRRLQPSLQTCCFGQVLMTCGVVLGHLQVQTCVVTPAWDKYRGAVQVIPVIVAQLTTLFLGLVCDVDHYLRADLAMIWVSRAAANCYSTG